MIGRLVLILAVLMPLTARAEIVLLCSQGVSALLESLKPDLERVIGESVVISFGVSQAVRQQIEQGAAFDVTILARDQLDQLAAKGAIVPGSQADIARSGIGIAIRQGAAKPDLSSVQSFKAMLLNSQGIAFTSAGASGLYLQKLLERLDIQREMADKLRPQPSGRAAEQVADGRAQYAFQQISELLGVPGSELAGPLPADLQIYTSFAAGIGAKAANPAGARKVIEFLTAPERAKVIAEKGMLPG